MSAPKIEDLTPAQVQALTAYAKQHGRTWKSSLRRDWMRTHYPTFNGDPAPLQQIRNQFGPAWLEKVRLP